MKTTNNGVKILLFIIIVLIIGVVLYMLFPKSKQGPIVKLQVTRTHSTTTV